MTRCSNYLELMDGGQYYGLVGIRPIEDRNNGIHHNIMHWLRIVRSIAIIDKWYTCITYLQFSLRKTP
jgi:hypothetical protein